MTESQTTTNDRFRGLATAAAFASLLSFAVALLTTPACNNEIARAFHASLGQLGELALAASLGFFFALLWCGGFTDRRGKLPSIFAGCVSMVIGALVFAQSDGLPEAIVGAALMGIGGGFTEGPSMALLADIYEDSRRTSMMNLCQAMFGVGAVAAPLGVGWLLRSGLSWRYGYLGAAVVATCAAVLALLALAMRRERPVGTHETRVRRRKLLTDGLVLTLSVGIMLYVGGEIGQSTWLSVYFKRYLGAGRALAAASPSFMWLGIWLGRVTAAWVSRHVSEVALICWCMALASASEAALLLIGGPIAGTAAAFALGFFLAPVFPTIVSCAAAAYPEASGSVTSVVIAAGSLGSAIFPPAVGWTADALGLRPALWICFTIFVIDLAVFLALRSRTKRVAAP